MRQVAVIVAFMGCLVACGSTFNAPFSSGSLPNSVSVGGGSGKALTHTGLANGASLSGPRNVNPSVVGAGACQHMLKLATNPELYPKREG